MVVASAATAAPASHLVERFPGLPVPPTPSSAPSGGATRPGTPLPPSGPSATDPHSSPSSPAEGGSWWPDIGARVREAINAWLAGLVAGAVGPAAATAGGLMDPARLTATGTVYQLWADSRAIANTIFVLLVLAGGVIVLGFETLQSRYAIKQIAPRLLWGWLAANLSWPLLTTLTQLGAALAVAVAGTNLQPADILGRLLGASISDGPTFLVILAGVVAVLALVLARTLIVVITVLLGLTVAAPLALCLHALPQTEAIAWWWWRAFAGALAIPTLHALLLALLARVLLTPGGLALGAFGLPLTPAAPGSLVNLLVVIALLYVMIKIPGWVLRAATGTTGRRGGLVRGVLSSVALTAGVGALGVPLPAAALAGLGGRLGPGLLSSRTGWAGLGLRAAATHRTPRSASHASPGAAARSARSRSATPARSPASAAASEPAAHADPYARIRVERDGQLVLPLPGLTRRRQSPAPAGPSTSTTVRTAPAAGTPPRPAGPRGQQRGRQLSLPLGRDWPEHRPVLGRDGQYRLPLHTPRAAGPPRTVGARLTPEARRDLARDPQPRATPRPGSGQLPLPLIWPRPPRRRPRQPATERSNQTDRERGTL